MFGDEGHRQIVLLGFLTYVMDDDDGEAWPCRRPCLPAEALDELGVGGALGTQYLGRDNPVQLGIARLGGDGETDASDLFEDLVLANAPACCHGPAPPCVGANPPSRPGG